MIAMTGTKVGILLRYNMVSNQDILDTYTRTHTHTHTHTQASALSCCKSPGKAKSVLYT